MRTNVMNSQIDSADRLSGDARCELDIARTFAVQLRPVPAGREIYAEGEPSDDLYIVTDGWVFLHQILEDGRRQILDFALPGAWLGFQTVPGTEMCHTAEALTDVTVAVIPRDRLGEIFARQPEYALRFVSAAAGALNDAYESLTDVGRRTAREAVAHLLVRLHARVAQNCVDGDCEAIAFPLTQEHIGDALGLTAVHVCRTLRSLREQGVVQLCKSKLTILDADGLSEIAGCGHGEVIQFSGSPRRAALPRTSAAPNRDPLAASLMAAAGGRGTGAHQGAGGR